jgi:outer membrane protein
MKGSGKRVRGAALAAALALGMAAPAMPAGNVDIGYIDQAQIGALPQFQRANRELGAYGDELQRQFTARARGASAADQQRLASELQGKMAERQRAVLGPLFSRAQVAIASIASSKNLSVVIDKRIVIFGGVDITSNVRDLLGGVGDPVPPVNTPPPSSVGYVDQTQIDAVPKIKSATDEFGKYKSDQDKATGEKLKSAKNDADRNAILKDYQKALETKQGQLLKPWIDRTRDAMSQVARKRGLILVVDRSDVIYGGTDITADVTGLLK